MGQSNKTMTYYGRYLARPTLKKYIKSVTH